ncbi:DNA-3-methyladenine glycosylase I [Brevundimonas sp. NPDC058933]
MRTFIAPVYATRLFCQTVAAWMQAVGMVNDHQTTCFRHGEVGNI